MVGLAELTDKVLADLMRERIRSGLVSQSTSRSPHASREKITPPVGDDLPGYLRMLHRWLCTSEIADLLHCHVETVYRRIKYEELPAHRDGRRWKFDPAEVAHWIEI
jgi:excisionase family DNA binding protein